MLSFEECEPKRPPRWQKFPLASGTEKFDTTIGLDSIVTSTKNTSWRASWHSLRICSSTIITKITYFAILVLGEFRDRHFEHRENRVRAVEGQHVDLTDNRIAQILRRRFLRTVQKLFAVDDLQHAALVGAVAEIHAIALRAGRDRPMQLGRHRAGRSGLLPNQAEVADMNRL